MSYEPSHEEQAAEFKRLFEETYRRRRDRLSYIVKVALNVYGEDRQSEIEEIFTDTYISCYNKIKRDGLRVVSCSVHDGRSARFYMTYFDQALYNNFLFAFSKLKNSPKFSSLDFHQDIQLIEDEEEDLDYAAHIQKAMVQLPEKYREIIYMVASGMKYKEMTKTLGLSMAQVKMRVLNARKEIIAILPRKLAIRYASQTKLSKI